MPTSRRPFDVCRAFALLLALLVSVLAPLTAPPAAWAAGGGPTTAAGASASAFSQGPANSDQLALYARIASVNTCIATGAGQDFEQAASIAGETIAQLILGVHKGLIQTSGNTPLSIEDLRKGSINAAVIGATEICPKEVPSDLSEKVRQALASAAIAPGS